MACLISLKHRASPTPKKKPSIIFRVFTVDAGQGPRGARSARGGQGLPGGRLPLRLPPPGGSGAPAPSSPAAAAALRASAPACQEVRRQTRKISHFLKERGKKKKIEREEIPRWRWKSEGGQPAGSAEPRKGLCPPRSPAELWQAEGRGENLSTLYV